MRWLLRPWQSLNRRCLRHLLPPLRPKQRRKLSLNPSPNPNPNR